MKKTLLAVCLISSVGLLSACSGSSEPAPNETSKMVAPTFAPTGTLPPVVVPSESPAPVQPMTGTAPSDTPTTAVPTPTGSPTSPPVRRAAMYPMQGKEYGSVEELARDSSFIAVVYVDEQMIVRETMPPTTTRVAYVQDSFKKDIEQQSAVDVQEPGDGREPYSLRPGPYYVLFLTGDKGNYRTVGGSQGVYVIEGDVARPVDTRAKSLPPQNLDAMLTMLEKR